jgi:hypothetical protein
MRGAASITPTNDALPDPRAALHDLEFGAHQVPAHATMLGAVRVTSLAPL